MSTDYSTMSKDELSEEIGKTFGQASQYVHRGEALPTDIWTSMNQTVASLCQRVGIDAPKQLVEDRPV